MTLTVRLECGHTLDVTHDYGQRGRTCPDCGGLYVVTVTSQPTVTARRIARND